MAEVLFLARPRGHKHMADTRNSTLSEIGEFGLIRKLTSDIILRHPGSRKGIGDDAAVIDHNGFVTLVTTDLLLEGIHFDLSYVPLKHLGYKSVVVNLSDVYAMNGTPLQITMGIGIPAGFPVSSIEEFYKGVKLACNNYDIDLIGGDTSASASGFVISVTALGKASAGQVVYRKGASAGDLICVSGDLGAAGMGLNLLETEKRRVTGTEGPRVVLGEYRHILERQLKPEARRDIGRLLQAARIKPTAMIDVSDGLSSDLLHICQASGTGSRVFASRIPIHPETGRLAGIMRVSPLAAALNGGEDYELLFTVSPEFGEVISGIAEISLIGIMTEAGDGNQLEFADRSTAPMEAGGWNAGHAWRG